MSHGNRNHEGHEGHEGFTIRLGSPLSRDVEALVTRVIGRAVTVHRQLGAGFLKWATAGIGRKR